MCDNSARFLSTILSRAFDQIPYKDFMELSEERILSDVSVPEYQRRNMGTARLGRRLMNHEQHG